MPVHFWRQAGYYFSLYAVLGLVSPYLGYWLSHAMGSQGMVYALAAFYATMVFVPTLWGHAAFTPRNGLSAPGQWLSFGSLGAAVFALGLTQVSAELPVLTSCFLVLAFGVFFNALVTLVESISYTLLETPTAFSRVRLFGSLGFMVCSVALGGTLVMSHPWTFPYLLAAIMTVAWLQSVPYKRVSMPVPRAAAPLGSSLWISARKLWPLWVVVLTTQAAFACYFAFFALRLREVGYSGPLVGVLFGLATAAEIFMFFRMGAVVSRWPPRTLVIVSTALTALRWLALSFITSTAWFPVVVLAQLTQAFGFSIFHVATLRVLHESVPATHFGAVRGIQEAVGYGVGGVIGVLLAGRLWASGDHSMVFLAACGLAIVSCLFSFFLPRILPSKTAP
jgi:PPP family 3-phenylpropionic acid transporter